MERKKIGLMHRLLATVCALVMLTTILPHPANIVLAAEEDAVQQTAAAPGTVTEAAPTAEAVPEAPVEAAPAPAVPEKSVPMLLTAPVPTALVTVKITGITFPDKSFDGTTDVQETPTYTFDPLPAADETFEVTGLTFTHADANASDGQAVTVSGTPVLKVMINGVEDTAKYQLDPDLTAVQPTINVKAAQVKIDTITFADKIYNTNTEVDAGTAQYTFVPAPAAGETYAVTGLTFTHADANVSDGQAVTIGGTPVLTVNGAENANYALDPDLTAVQPTINVKAAEAEFTVTVEDKFFDNTDVVKSVTATAVPAFPNLSVDVTADQFLFDRVGTVEQDTPVGLKLKDPAAVFTVKENGTATANYTAKLTLRGATIKAAALAAGSYQLTGGYADAAGKTWYKGNTLTVQAAAGYTISSELTGTYGNTAQLTVKADGSSELYVKNTDGSIARASISVNMDQKGPAVNPVEQGLTFGKENKTYNIQVTDAESGLKTGTIQYGIGTADAEPSAWTPAAGAQKDQLTITVPTEGILYVKAEDNVGNLTTMKLNAFVLETAAPAINVSNSTDWTTTHTVSVTADDSDSTPYYSGVKSISYSVKDSTGAVVVAEKTEATATAPDSLAAIQPTLNCDIQLDGVQAKLDGTYTVVIKAEDFCGNVAETTASLNFDTTGPEITAKMDGATKTGAEYYYREDNANLTVTFKDAHSGLKDGKVTVTGPDGQAQDFVLDPAAGVVQIAKETFTQDGTYKVKVSATDLQGNAVDQLTSVDKMTLSADKKEAHFQLDVTAPAITAVKATAPAAGCDYSKTEKKVYFNNQFEVAFTVQETNFLEKNVQAQMLLNGQAVTGDAGQAVMTDGQAPGEKIITFTVAKGAAPVANDAYQFTLQLTDLVGHQLSLTAPAPAGLDNQVTLAEQQDTSVTPAKTVVVATTALTYVLDTKAPILTLDFDDCKGHFYENEGTYYNRQFMVTYTFADENKDVVKLFTQHNADREIHPHSKDGTRRYWVNQEGPHQFFAWGADKAGNLLTVTERDMGAKNETKSFLNIGTKANYKSEVKFLDVTAPAAVLAITPGSGVARTYLQNNRYFFNKPFTAQWTVTEANPDVKKMTVKKGVNPKAKNYVSDPVRANTLVNVDAAAAKTKLTYTVKSSGDGLYAFSLAGEDKAGNPVIMKSRRNVQTAAKQKDGTTLFTSYVTAVDTKAPIVTVTMDDFYKAKLDGTKYNISVNMPYQKKTTATAGFKSEDTLPVELKYSIESSKRANNVTAASSGYVYGAALSHKYDDKQILSLTALTATDKAGNVSKLQAATNHIYLDVDAPNMDELAPTVELTTTATHSNRGPEGTDLYKDTVGVQAKVSDPYPDSSSGLYKTFFKVLVNGDDWTDKVSVSSGSGQAGKGEVTYGTGGPEHGDTHAKDEALTASDVINFTFDAGTFNYNDVQILVWAQDNSGNDIGEANAATYQFGIDTTSPTILVTYDNNDVENEKYFKEDRTATITVTERNFSPDDTHVDTEGNVSGWSYTAGGQDNGDEDTWTCTVSYTVDGDYTLNVTAEDLLGHEAGEPDYSDSAAPTEFVLDKTLPLIEVSFDNQDVRNGKYYNAARVASVRIVEHNFRPTEAEITTTEAIAEGTAVKPTVGAFGSSGDENIAQVNFSADGDYTMEVQYTDLAGNQAEPISVEEFTVDTTAPEIEIGGVEDQSANKGTVAPSIIYHDINYDPDGTSVSITGRRNQDGTNLNGSAKEDAMGGSFICENIEELPENDDVYICTGHVEDMAGNESEATIRFSVNRFGSNYILSETTEALVQGYYTGKPVDLVVTEINVDSLEFQEITAVYNGEILTLEEGKDYRVDVSGGLDTWKQYTYTVYADLFKNDGTYNLTFHSVDSAGNENTNRTMQVTENAQPIDFVLDTTAPVNVVTGVETEGRYVEGGRLITVYVEDNIGLSRAAFYLDDEKVAEFDAEEIKAAAGTLSYEVSSKNKWQTFSVKTYDLAQNISEENSVRFLLTKNLLIQYFNNTPVLVGSLVALLVLVFLLIWRKKKREGKEQ